MLPKGQQTPATSVTLYRFLYYTVQVLPCRYCRESGTRFVEQLNPFNSLLSSKGTITPCAYQAFWISLHNCVNGKLSYNYDEQLHRKKIQTKLNPIWESAFWMLMYSLAANYPEKADLDTTCSMVKWKYRCWLSLLAEITNVSESEDVRNFGRFLSENFMRECDIWDSRETLFAHVHKSVSQRNKSLPFQFVELSLEDRRTVTEAFRARNITCQSHN
jgi:hypothetical protein